MRHTAVIYTPTADGLAASHAEMNDGNNPMGLVHLTDGPEIRTYDFQGVTPDVLARHLRRLADELDHAYRVWLDENAETWGRDENGYYRDCGGYFEHFDGCPVGEAIRAARHTLARAGVVRDLGPGVESEGDQPCDVCAGSGTVLDPDNGDTPIACPQCRTDAHVAARAAHITQAAS